MADLQVAFEKSRHSISKPPLGLIRLRAVSYFSLQSYILHAKPKHASRDKCNITSWFAIALAEIRTRRILRERRTAISLGLIVHITVLRCTYFKQFLWERFREIFAATVDSRFLETWLTRTEIHLPWIYGNFTLGTTGGPNSRCAKRL